MDTPPHREWIDPEADPRSIDELISAALSGSDEETYGDAIMALHLRGSREAFDRASALCRSFCPIERSLGANILGQLGVPERSFPAACFHILLGMLNAEWDPGVLNSILIALHYLGHRPVIVPAARFRQHAHADVRFGVVWAMTGHDDPLAVETLIALTSDPDSDVRDWACFALGTMIATDTPELRDALAARLDDPDEDTRFEAIAGLAERGDRRIVPALDAILRSDSVATQELEAAARIADPGLHDSLLVLREWWDGNQELLERAIAACSPEGGR